MVTLSGPGADGTTDRPVAARSGPAPRAVETFGSAMLGDFCGQAGLRFATDEDGDARIEFGYAPARDCALTVYAYATGRSRSILCVRVESDKRFREARRTALLEAINEFHCERRWPKVYLKSSDRAVSVVCETQVDLAMGAHRPFVYDFIDTAISSANAFWRFVKARAVASVQDEWAPGAAGPARGGDEEAGE